MEKVNELAVRYLDKFGNEHMIPLLYTMSYDHPVYQELMKKGLDRGYPITNLELQTALKDVKADYVPGGK